MCNGKYLYPTISNLKCTLDGNELHLKTLKISNDIIKEGVQKSFPRICHPIKSMANELFIDEKLSFAEVS